MRAKVHGYFARKMIITGPGTTHGHLLRAGSGAEIPDTNSYSDQRFHSIDYVAISDAKVTMPPVLPDL